MGRPLGGRAWDDVLGSILELLDGVYATVVLAVVGGLLGLGAARLLDIRGWVDAGAGSVLVPLLVILFVRAAARERDCR